MIPKTEVEFRANLGAVVSKSIELKNPSQKAISYDVTLEGSSDFRAKGSEVNIWQGADFVVSFVYAIAAPLYLPLQPFLTWRIASRVSTRQLHC